MGKISRLRLRGTSIRPLEHDGVSRQELSILSGPVADVRNDGSGECSEKDKPDQARVIKIQDRD